MGENSHFLPKETTDKGLISKIYKQLIQLNARKTNNPSKNREKDLNRDLSKENIGRRLDHISQSKIYKQLIQLNTRKQTTQSNSGKKT